jgi:hypothetical protein
MTINGPYVKSGMSLGEQKKMRVLFVVPVMPGRAVVY